MKRHEKRNRNSRPKKRGRASGRQNKKRIVSPNKKRSGGMAKKKPTPKTNRISKGRNVKKVVKRKSVRPVRRVTKRKLSLQPKKKGTQGGFKKVLTKVSLKKNLLSIELPSKDLKGKINSINSWDDKATDKFRDKFSDKFPRAFQVVLQTKKRKKTFEQASKISPVDMAVTKENVKKLIHEAISDFQDNFYSIMENSQQEQTDSSWVFDPTQISKVFVRYFYAQD